MGLPSIAIEAYLQQEKRQTDIDVLECNWVACHVMQRCQMTLVLGYGIRQYTGLSAQEVLAVMPLFRVPPCEELDVLDATLEIAAAWCDAKNEQMR